MSLEAHYRTLTEVAGADLKGAATEAALRKLITESLKFIKQADLVPLISKVPGKKYAMASYKGRYSRPINQDLFDVAKLKPALLDAVFKLQPSASPLVLDKCLYTVAMSYPVANDLEKDGDKKSPGTFFEILMGHIFAARYAVNPIRQILIPTLDEKVLIPTDFIFELGNNRRIHLPIKLSTRERVVQVWAHQRMLDGMHGVGRFKGILVCLTETNKQKNKSVVEVCLPNQWTAYQMFIAQLDRVYYLDVPVKYVALRNKFPHIQVWPLSKFFEEADKLFNSQII